MDGIAVTGMGPGHVEEISAGRALSYALSRHALVLLGVFLVGRMLPLMGRWTVEQTRRLAHGPELLITTGTSLLGMVLMFAAIVGLAFKLLEDTRG